MASRRTGPAWVRERAGCVVPGVGPGAEAVEVGRWRGVCWQPGVLRGAVSLGPGCLMLTYWWFLVSWSWSWSWSTISPGRASRGSCQSFTWVETGYCCPRHSLICAWRALGRTRALLHSCPRLGPAGQWEAAARVSGSAAVTPGRTRLPAG